MAKKSVFVSFDYDNDRHYKDLLCAWDANPDFDFSFNETFPKVAVDSNDAEAIKSVLAQKIGAATHLLAIIGKYTYSGWVGWEINKAKELKKKLVAVKIDREYTAPAALFGSGATWAMSFTRDAVLEALKEA
jgi:Thoeris protein ThsB, TIR-like domain